MVMVLSRIWVPLKVPVLFQPNVTAAASKSSMFSFSMTRFVLPHPEAGRRRQRGSIDDQILEVAEAEDVGVLGRTGDGDIIDAAGQLRRRGCRRWSLVLVLAA